MKRILAIMLAIFMALSLMAGCNNNDNSSTPDSQSNSNPDTNPDTKVLKVANLVNGNLGDKSFFDSAEAGLAELKAAGKIEYKTFEMGATDADQPKWVSTLDEVSASGEYDIIICGTYQMPAYLFDAASNYPDQKYVVYDSDFGKDDAGNDILLDNVVSLQYKQNVMGYLVGTAAALATSSDMDKMNAEKVIGFVGGEDGPVINDFLVGFIQGAVAADPEVKIDSQFVGNFYDTGNAKEIANVMIGTNKCDVIWGVAGGAGNGAAEAANELGAWFIGVDSDQEATFSISQPELAAVTMFSGLKNIGDSLIWLVDEELAGKTYYGQNLSLGLDEGGVGLATDGNYKLLPDDIKAAVEEASKKIVAGEIVVDTAFGDEAVDPAATRDAVRP